MFYIYLIHTWLYSAPIVAIRNTSVDSYGPCDCYKPCTETKYEVKVSSMAYPSKVLADWSEANILGWNLDKVRYRYLLITIEKCLYHRIVRIMINCRIGKIGMKMNMKIYLNIVVV